MLISKAKLPYVFGSIESIIESFPEVKKYIDDRAHLYTDELVDGENDMDILYKICIGFFKHQLKHYTVLGFKERIIVTEMDIRFIVVLDDKPMICVNEEHLKQIYTDAVFLFYGSIDKSIHSIAKNNKTYEMAVDIHHRINTMNIRILQQE